jgi:hypothetical protein
MAEQTTTDDVEAQMELLVDVDGGLVEDDDNAVPRLALVDEQSVDVRKLLWPMAQEPRRWVHQLPGERLWRLTYRGRDAMKAYQAQQAAKAVGTDG